MGEAESVDLQISDSAPGKHSSVLMQWSRYSQGPGMNMLSPVNHKETPGKDRKTLSEHSITGLNWPAEWEVTLFCKSATSIFLGASCRGQLKSQSISQFGLAPHFRQVPVGIYNTFSASSSLSAALTLNASTTYLTDIFLGCLSRCYFVDCCIFKARPHCSHRPNRSVGWSITL